jgi:predicted DNA-binding transcriptional regulator AlpA
MARKQDKLLTAGEVAELTGLGVKTIYAGKCGADQFVRVRIGKRNVRWSRNSVVKWVEERVRAAANGQQENEGGPANVLPFRKRKIEDDAINDIVKFYRLQTGNADDDNHTHEEAEAFDARASTSCAQQGET